MMKSANKLGGFQLLELLVSVAIMGLLMVSIGVFLPAVSLQWNQALVHSSARVGLKDWEWRWRLDLDEAVKVDTLASGWRLTVHSLLPDGTISPRLIDYTWRSSNGSVRWERAIVRAGEGNRIATITSTELQTDSAETLRQYYASTLSREWRQNRYVLPGVAIR